MTVFIVLFRGVGGATQLPVKPLREALTAAGFENAATYINSGNAVVRTTLSRDEAAEKIAALCAEKFGFRKALHLVSREEWAALIAANPFPEGASEGKRLHAAVLAREPEAARVEALRALAEGRDRIAVVGRVAYLHTPDGFGTSKLGEKFSKGIGVPNTARNWNTVLKLMELADEAGR